MHSSLFSFPPNYRIQLACIGEAKGRKFHKMPLRDMRKATCRRKGLSFSKLTLYLALLLLRLITDLLSIVVRAKRLSKIYLFKKHTQPLNDFGFIVLPVQPILQEKKTRPRAETETEPLFAMVMRLD